MLANRIPQSLSSPPTRPETRDTFPNVKYWTRQDWTTANADRVADLDEGGTSGARGRTRAAQGINVNMKYIEDKDGQAINGHLASDIRRHARAIFVGFALEGRLFASWTEADHTSLKVYYREMAERFEELRLCANDWKAEMIALDVYRTWRDQWQKKQQKNKTGNGKNRQLEDDDDQDKSHDNDDGDNDDVSVKRGIDYTASDNEQPSKRIKKGNSTPNPAMAFPVYAVPPQMVRILVTYVLHMILIPYKIACYSEYQCRSRNSRCSRKSR